MLYEIFINIKKDVFQSNIESPIRAGKRVSMLANEGIFTRVKEEAPLSQLTFHQITS